MGVEALPVSQSVSIGPNGSERPIKRAAISGASANNTLVGAVTGKRILVVFANLSWIDATTTGSWKLQSGASTDLTPAFQTLVTSNGFCNIVWPYNPFGWVITVVSEKLNLVLATVDSFASLIGYVEV